MCYSSDAAESDDAAPTASLQGTRYGDASHDVQQQLWAVIDRMPTAEKRDEGRVTLLSPSRPLKDSLSGRPPTIFTQSTP